MIIPQCQELDRRLDRLDELRAADSAAEVLRAAKDDLDDPLGKLRAEGQKMLVLLAGGVVRPADVPDPSRARRKLDEIRDKYAKSQRFPERKTLIKWLGELATAIEQTARTRWEEWFDAQRPKTDETHLQRFEQDAELGSIVDRVRRLNQQAALDRRQPPVSKEQFEEVLRRFESLRSTWARIPISDDPEVQAFLDAANTPSGAPLPVSQTVLDWLTASGLLGSFGVRRT